VGQGIKGLAYKGAGFLLGLGSPLIFCQPSQHSHQFTF
jgi:hypothetical protein